MRRRARDAEAGEADDELRPPALAIEDVVAGYGGVPVLDGCRSRQGPRTITAVLGANGAGKTTLLRTISGFVRPRRGRIAVGGANLARRRPEDDRPGRRRARARGPGRDHRADRRGEPAARRAASGTASDRAAALAETYERFPVLADRRRRLAGTLSGGERQILVIARALMAAPRVLLLDEPSLGLAPQIVAQIMGLIRQLRDDTGLTVLLVEQNARSALAIADLGIVLNLGKVVAEAEAARRSPPT